MGVRGHGDGSALDSAKWGGETQNGTSSVLTFAEHRFAFQQLLKTAKGCDANTEVLTLTLGYQARVDAPGGVQIEDFLARVGWGVGGARHEADVDVRKGTQISVPADHIDVVVRYQDILPADELPDVPIPSAIIRATVGWGTRPGFTQVTRSFPRQVIAAGGFADFLVPDFASTLHMFATAIFPGYAATTDLVFFGGPTAGAAPIVAAYTGNDARAAAVTPGLRVPSSARSLRITNGAALSMIVAPSFSLGF